MPALNDAQPPEKTLMYKVVSILGFAAFLSLAACSRQQSDWEKARAANTTDGYEQFLKNYPSGEFTAQAQARARELYEERDWQKARDIDSADAYQAFLKQYPEGKWSEEARIRIENFTLAAAPSNGAPGNAAASPTSDAAARPVPALPSAPAVSPAPSAAAPTQPSAPQPAHEGVQKPPLKAAAATVSGPASAVGRYAVQLGAFKSGEDAANKRWANLSGKYPKLLSGLAPRISPRKGAAGTLYRLQVTNLSAKRARAICTGLKAHAQSCEVLRPRH
jgi:cell division protein FtsN